MRKGESEESKKESKRERERREEKERHSRHFNRFIVKESGIYKGEDNPKASNS